MSYVFSFTSCHRRSFYHTLVAASISHVVIAATRFSCCFPNKKNISFFLSLALDLCRPFYRQASLACRLLCPFLCLSLALYSRFVGMTINLSLILQTARIQKQFPLSVFVFIYSLVVQRVAMRFPAKITSSCIWVFHTC